MSTKPLFRFIFLLLCVLLSIAIAPPSTVSAQSDSQPLVVQPGDTWQALAWRFRAEVNDLHLLNGVVNPLQEPAIGATVRVATDDELSGALARVLPLQPPSLIALRHSATFSQLSNALTGSPVDPILATYTPILLEQVGGRIADLPPNFASFEMSHRPGVPGQGMAVRGQLVAPSTLSITLKTTTIEPLPFDVFQDGAHVVGLRGTGAFYPVGTQLIEVDMVGMPLWSQAWLFADGDWEFQEVNFTGAAAQIDNAAIANERTRMFAQWSIRHPDPFWRSEFAPPIRAEDIYAFSSGYGARRSYNGGPYSSYHEGVDYAAFEGVAALATTEGIVVVAEPLYVRGGAVVIAHGLGIYSGYYHLSEVMVNVGDIVALGEQVGAVGTTGLSTGNHLHWDFLVTETWVGADEWAERGMGCWVLEGLGKRCIIRPNS